MGTGIMALILLSIFALRCGATSSRHEERKLAVINWVYVQSFCNSAIKYSYLPVDSCFYSTSLAAYVKITGASATSATPKVLTGSLVNYGTDKTCTTTSSTTSLSFSNTCTQQSNAASLFGSADVSVELVSSISTSAVGYITEYYSDSTCSTKFAWTVDSMFVCQKGTSTSSKRMSSSTTAQIYTTYSDANCGTSTASNSIPIISTCTAVATNNVFYTETSNVVSTYYKESLPSNFPTQTPTKAPSIDRNNVKYTSIITVAVIVPVLGGMFYARRWIVNGATGDMQRAIPFSGKSNWYNVNGELMKGSVMQSGRMQAVV